MSGIRIIGGEARGRRLNRVPGDSTRPITDRVKEALFNIIGTEVIDSTWLDLFAGTGSVGIEALSRGAAWVRFVDLDRLAIQTIWENLKLIDYDDDELAEVRRADAFQVLSGKPDTAFDYIYIAPPQYKKLWSRALTLLDGHTEWLSEESWVIVQIAPKEDEMPPLKNLVEIDRRRYGNTLLIFFELK